MAVEHNYVRKDYNLSYILYNLWKETPDPVFVDWYSYTLHRK